MKHVIAPWRYGKTRPDDLILILVCVCVLCVLCECECAVCVRVCCECVSVCECLINYLGRIKNLSYGIHLTIPHVNPLSDFTRRAKLLSW